MLTLLEPPGAKRSPNVGNYNNRSAQHLLNLGKKNKNKKSAHEKPIFSAPDEEDLYETYDENEDYAENERTGNILTRFLDRYLVGQSSSADYNDRWKREFRARPSWCDADLCLQQMNRGKATGNRYALYSRSLIQKLLFALGNAVHRNAWSIILVVSMIFAFCCYGLQYVHIETDIVKLWVAQGGRLDEELNFLPNMKELMRNESVDSGPEIPRENGLGGGYQVLIQTPEFEGQDALAQGPLLKHVEIMKHIASFNVSVHGVDWSLSDICFKPAPPSVSPDSPAASLSDVIDKIVPCIWITPIDCFWEGSKALGPHPSLPKSALGLVGMLLKALPDHDMIRWSDFDPIKVIDEIHNSFNLGSHYTFFERAGVGHGYMNRPCIDPLDPECPPMAKNYFDVCPHVDKIREVASKYGQELEQEKQKDTGFDVFSFFGRKKRETDQQPQMIHPAQPADSIPVVEGAVPADIPVTADPVTTTTTLSREEVENAKKIKDREMREHCKSYRKSTFNWLKANQDKWTEVMPENVYPKNVDYAEEMTGGCSGFASNVLNWPEDMILGNPRHTKRGGKLTSADALQSVFLVASPADVFLRFKQKQGRNPPKSGLDQEAWNETAAEQVLQAWQRNFTKSLYTHEANFDADGNERRTLHPLASTSIADMLEEFCQFNYTIIFAGYALMLAYAIITQARFDSCLPATESSMGLALAGVLVVTFASVAGLGLATWFGIEFNAATTQIVPFLTLGIGVDNMFMLLHNYRDVVKLAGGHAEMAILMRETGMSILCTSINNILSFLTGTLLPIPALRSFCAQSSILLTFNFIAILTIYPAIISIDLRRKKAQRRDLLCCLYGDTREESYSMISKPKIPSKRIIGAPSEASIMQQFDGITQAQMASSDDPAPYSLHAFIRYYYIPFISRPACKVGIIIGCLVLLAASVYGMQQSTLGLELGDVLPEHTAPAQFLRARDKYFRYDINIVFCSINCLFSFYPMFAVIKGPNIDYAHQQRQIDNYRQSIGSSKFVIKNKNEEPSEKYWLGLMRDWLISIQRGFDEEVAKGSFDLVTGTVIAANVSEDARIAHALMCSHGELYECAGRVGKIRLVDASGIINSDGFYNYLTAWFNVDHMMYYVSQASFFPTPPKWELVKENKENFIPAAKPLVYSQIPFYLTGLTDTGVIVEAIKDIRSVCDRFTDQGLPNFPQGIAFTFWEQYLFLTGNLMQAISIITISVFCVISVLLFNPWAALMVVCILGIMTCELAGFMGLVGIKLNPVSAVTLITAVGIGVEFTVHVVVSFLTALGTRAQRTSSAVDRVFVPVIHGSFSTLLGILMLGFSEFEFVVKYFFIVMTALIGTGIINGLILLPVLLSWFGPRREISPADGKTTLALPPPLPKNLNSSRSGGDDSDEDDEPSGLVMYSRQAPPSRTSGGRRGTPGGNNSSRRLPAV
ncbi:Protein CBG03294 [Caenorhabditis briggsae]|uniref:Protein CBG03294 n=1 Tax=Caenorhabditis briggsae TaxID=6238 RepID=A8WSD1_CAEBR|nr:Protein CBG03294 [Caenorhabditis briggsae]CAP23390.2 Protein CBG03294 [Caenorhabditis briggsae]